MRSVAVPIREGDGRAFAAMDVTVHAAETSLDAFTQHHLPKLRHAASAISSDWDAWQRMPVTIAFGLSCWATTGPGPT
ncbi:hypothetical protein G3I56_18015 [Streptomyces sp. SID12488]|nr:hypothetical protein [Streptomyces sp. SID12488]